MHRDFHASSLPHHFDHTPRAGGGIAAEQLKKLMEASPSDT